LLVSEVGGGSVGEQLNTRMVVVADLDATSGTASCDRLKELMIGSKIGPYRVIRLLGEGGMGAVYEAINDDIERRIAIKVLHADYARQSDVVARFFNEARAVNRIDHPSLVQIHEYGHLPDGTAYIVMEFLKGETLARRLIRLGGRMPPQVAVQIAWEVAAALAAAHDKNIVHRDLKPANLMLVPDPLGPRGERVKVLDFGIAKLVADARHGKTSTNMVMGTPTYMSPEQCKGAGTVDDKTDVYSLGVILYEMLAGRPPFMAEGAGELMGSHLFQPPPSIRDFAPEAPADLGEFIHLLLSKDKTQRPLMRDVMERLAALSTSLEGLATGAPKTIALLATSADTKNGAPTVGQAPSSMMELARGQSTSPVRTRKPLIAVLVGGCLLSAGLATWLLVPFFGTSMTSGSMKDPNIPAIPSPVPALGRGVGKEQQEAPSAAAEIIHSETKQNESSIADRSALEQAVHVSKRATRKKAQLSPREEATTHSDEGLKTGAASASSGKRKDDAAAKQEEQEKAALDSVLKVAQSALDNRNYKKAIETAKMALSERPKAAWLIVGAAGCKSKDIKLADDSFRQLDSEGQRLLLNTCLASGVEHRANGFAVAKP